MLNISCAFGGSQKYYKENVKFYTENICSYKIIRKLFKKFIGEIRIIEDVWGCLNTSIKNVRNWEIGSDIKVNFFQPSPRFLIYEAHSADCLWFSITPHQMRDILATKPENWWATFAEIKQKLEPER